jgi:hypothetical protein
VNEHYIWYLDTPTRWPHGSAKHTVFMLDLRIDKLASSAAAEMAVIATKAAWKPREYEASSALFLGSASAMLRRMKM